MATAYAITLTLPHKLALLPPRSIRLVVLAIGHAMLALAPLLALVGLSPLYALITALLLFTAVYLRPHILLLETIKQSLIRLAAITALHALIVTSGLHNGIFSPWLLLVMCQSPLSLWDALAMWHRRPLWTLQKSTT